MSDRINFGKLKEVLPIPDLIGLQLDSYRNFLQKDVPRRQVVVVQAQVMKVQQALEYAPHQVFRLGERQGLPPFHEV